MKIKKPKVANTSGKKLRLTRANTSSKLFADDHRTVQSLTTAWGVPPGEVIRLIVYDWLRAQRVKSLGDESDSDSLRPIYERVLDEKLAPLAEALRQLQSGPGQSHQNAGHQTTQTAGPVLEAIAGLRELIEQASSDLAETDTQQLDQLHTLTRAVGLTNSLAGESFIANWMIRDLLIRYIVEVELMTKHSDPEDLERAVGDEKLVLWQEGNQQVQQIQSSSDLPPGLRFTHNEQVFQATIHDSAANPLT